MAEDGSDGEESSSGQGAEVNPTMEAAEDHEGVTKSLKASLDRMIAEDLEEGEGEYRKTFCGGDDGNSMANTVELAKIMSASGTPEDRGPKAKNLSSKFKANDTVRRMSSRRLKSRVLLSQYLNKVDVSVGTRLLSAFEREDVEWKSNQDYGSRKAITSRKLVRKRTMFRAAELGHGEIMLVLLRQGSTDPNTVDPKTGQTALIRSAIHGHLDCVIALLSARARVDMTDRWGFTALHYAAKYDRGGICAHLIKRGADKNAFIHINGRTPLELACEWGSVSAGKLLLQKNCKVRYRIPSPKWKGQNEPLPWWALPKPPFDVLAVLLLVTTSEGDLKRVDGILNYIKDAKKRVDELTPIQLARLEVPGVRPHIIDYRQTPKRRTSLHYAAQKNQAAAASKLLESCKEHRKMVDVFDDDGKTALAVACKAGALATAKTLIRFGASVHRESMMAAPTGALQEVLLTPLQIACVKGSSDFVEFLLRMGSDVNKKSESQLTPLHIALWNHHDHIGVLLLHGLESWCCAEFTCVDTHGVSPLMVACYRGCEMSLRAMIEKQSISDSSEDNNEITLSQLINAKDKKMD
eukprot:g3743.t1